MQVPFIEGKKVIFEHRVKIYTTRAPLRDEESELQPVLLAEDVSLFIKEGKDGKEELVGNARYHVHPSYRVYSSDNGGIHVWDFRVEPEFRGKGLGTLLLDYVVKIIDFKFNEPVCMTLNPLDVSIKEEKLAHWCEELGFVKIEKGDNSVSEKAKEWMEKEGVVFMERPSFSSMNDGERHDLQSLCYLRLFDNESRLYNETDGYSEEISKRCCMGSKILKFLKDGGVEKKDGKSNKERKRKRDIGEKNEQKKKSK